MQLLPISATGWRPSKVVLKQARGDLINVGARAPVRFEPKLAGLGSGVVSGSLPPRRLVSIVMNFAVVSERTL